MYTNPLNPCSHSQNFSIFLLNSMKYSLMIILPMPLELICFETKMDTQKLIDILSSNARANQTNAGGD